MICSGFKRNGQPCCFKPKKGSIFCGHHQPKVPGPNAAGVDPSSPATQSTTGVVDNVVDPSLSTRLPAGLLGEAQRLLRVHKIDFEIVSVGMKGWNERHLGLWSYRNSQHKIQIMDTLTGVDFLDTFVHEIAHAVTWDKYKKSAQSHGKQWRDEYRQLMKPFLFMRVWTQSEIERLTKPAAVKKNTFDEMKKKFPSTRFLCELNVGDTFTDKGGTFMVKNKGKGANFYCSRVGDSNLWKFPKFYRLEAKSASAV
jgi:SprT protein